MTYAEAASQVFRPIPLFGALGSIPYHALYFGSLLGFQKLSAKSMELVRRQEDVWNELFGLGMLYPYYRYILNHSERRIIAHNRVVGSVVAISVVYANFLA